MNKDGGWEKVMVTSRYSRKFGYVKVKNLDSDKAGVDLATESWKYSVLGAEGNPDTYVMFVKEACWGEL